MYKKILGPLDGSQLSECALGHIKTIAMGCQVPDVVLLTVVGEPTTSFGEASSMTQVQKVVKERDESLMKVRNKAQDYLTTAAARLKKEGLAASTEVLVCTVGQNVADCILDYANRNQIDLIVMSTHGRSGVSRWAFGSVTDKVVRASTVPVLTVTPTGCRASPMI